MLVSLLVSTLQFMMLFRAVFSWMPLDEDSAIMNFIYFATEPIIIPVRMIVERSDTVKSMPIDISFIISFVLLSIVQVMLPPIF